jgi:hypothetical protein
MFDLTLLLEPDGTEYCFEEARARHLGLLGKKWPPPPPPNAAASSSRATLGRDSIAREGSVRVDFNDNGSKMARPSRRQSVTVTINTKQALEDVFDMYNSPVKEEPDVENAVQVEPRTFESPALLQTPAPSATRPPVFQDENASVATTKPRGICQVCRKLRLSDLLPSQHFNRTLTGGGRISLLVLRRSGACCGCGMLAEYFI